MAKKRASSSACRSKAPVGRGAGHGTTPDEQVVQDAPSIVPAAVPTVALPIDVVMRFLNVLEALVPNHGRLPVPQTKLQAQTQVQLNVAATQTP
ncbi:hypothetical protein HAX54_026790 [Datura stramonium]|uniref:Uncharacterized protein n=1 Tax=Datura stramonium TaxID=4076 RepID=A0ABS8V1I6_DATST|nr:hypothetical protein [Datura stramonium]